MRSGLTNLVALVAASTGGAGAAEVPQWTPGGNWTVEYAENQCIAARTYRLGDREMVVAFRPRPTVESVEIVVLAPGKAKAIDFVNAKVFLGQEEIDSRYLTITPAAKKDHLLYRFHLEAEHFEKLKRIERLAFKSGGFAFEVPLARLGDVRKVLDHCIEDLLVSWGVSSEVQASLATFPETVRDRRTYFRSDDYPRSALGVGAIGAVEVRVMVTTDGKPRDCKVITSSAHEGLDATTCAIVQRRARFRPARTTDGRAVEMPYLFVVHWRLM